MRYEGLNAIGGVADYTLFDQLLLGPCTINLTSRACICRGGCQGCEECGKMHPGSIGDGVIGDLKC
jgi:hypothetical protein